MTDSMIFILSMMAIATGPAMITGSLAIWDQEKEEFNSNGKLFSSALLFLEGLALIPIGIGGLMHTFPGLGG